MSNLKLCFQILAGPPAFFYLCPLYPRKRTFVAADSLSARGNPPNATGLSTALAYGPTSKICRTQIGWGPLQQGNEVEMLIRQLTVASLLSLAVISPGSTQAAKAPLALCKADAERICPGVAPGGGKIIACLRQHKDEVSVGCAKALKAMKTKMGT